MKVKINRVSCERQFEPFEFTIRVKTKAELNELLARFSDYEIDALDWSRGHVPNEHEHGLFEFGSAFICSALHTEYDKYRSVT